MIKFIKRNWFLILIVVGFFAALSIFRNNVKMWEIKAEQKTTVAEFMQLELTNKIEKKKAEAIHAEDKVVIKNLLSVVGKRKSEIIKLKHFKNDRIRKMKNTGQEFEALKNSHISLNIKYILLEKNDRDKDLIIDRQALRITLFEAQLYGGVFATLKFEGTYNTINRMGEEFDKLNKTLTKTIKMKSGWVLVIGTGPGFGDKGFQWNFLSITFGRTISLRKKK